MIEQALSVCAERWRRESAPGYMVAMTPHLGIATKLLFASLSESRATLQQQTAAWRCAQQIAVLYVGALPKPVASTKHVRRAREYLHAHFTEDISLDDLAAATGDLHPRYLLALFAQSVNIPPHQYLLHLRVDRVRELLASGSNAAQAAVRAGFRDQSQMHRHFVRILGLTPGMYARACR